MRRKWKDQTIPNIFGAVSAAVTDWATCLELVGDIIVWDIRTTVRRGAFGEERTVGYLDAAWEGIILRGPVY